MDSFEAALTSITLLAVIFLMVAFVCHYLGPRASAWFRSNREEKIGLSKSKIFNANGYMIHSGSDFLQLSSTGSFKRFDSIDRDYRQSSPTSLPTHIIPTTWRVGKTTIPPPPLRPAPLPPSCFANDIESETLSTTYHNSPNGFYGVRDKMCTSFINQQQRQSPPHQHQQQQQQSIIRTEKLSLHDNECRDKNFFHNYTKKLTTAIPRPTSKRPIPHTNAKIKVWNGEIVDGNKEFTMINHYEMPTKKNLNDDAANKIQRNFSSSLTSLPSSSLPTAYSPSLIQQHFKESHQQQQQQQQPLYQKQLRRNPSTNPFLNSSQEFLSNDNQNIYSGKNMQNNYQNNVNNNNSINYYLSKKNFSTNSLPQVSMIHQNIDYIMSEKENQRLFYQNENKNPFTADCVRLIQQQFGHKQEKNYHQNQQNNLIESPRSNSNEIFDLLPEMKEPPKTDLGKYSFFDFEPERITSVLQNELNQEQLTSQSQLEIHSTDEPSLISMESPKSPKTTNNDNKDDKTAETLNTPPPVNPPVIGNGNDEDDSKIAMKQKKYIDSPCSDVFDDIETLLKKHFRTRSLSDAETTEHDLKIFNRNRINSKSLNTNPFLEKSFSAMHKTISENFLTKSYCSNYFNPTWNFGRSLSRQDSAISLSRRNSTQSDNSDRFSYTGSLDSISLQRGISCESVNSQSSVVLADLEPVLPPVTGQLCVGLQYDKNTLTEEGIDLVVTVMEAKELIGPSNLESFDTFVRIYLVPDETGAMQTKLFKNSSSPSFNETFCFWLNKNRGRRSLWFHLYHSGSTHTLIGEAEMQISDVTATRPLTTWLALYDSRHNSAKWGELMFSLSYLPTAERLTVVVVKGRNLKFEKNGKEISIDTQNIFVKVYLLKDNHKVSKKKTMLKRKDRCPIFNESMIFSIPPYLLNSIQVRLTVMSVSDSSESFPIGHIIVGSNTNGKGIRHWNQMLSSLRKPVAMWHPLRKTVKVTTTPDVT